MNTTHTKRGTDIVLFIRQDGRRELYTKRAAQAAQSQMADRAFASRYTLGTWMTVEAMIERGLHRLHPMFDLEPVRGELFITNYDLLT